MNNTPFVISAITINESFISIFSEESFPKTARSGMLLTDRIESQNLRLRESAPGYVASWHVAGDPTLIIVQSGTLRITLRDGNYKDFSCGDIFIAKDYLPEHIKFDNKLHGHYSEVLGNEIFRATHIKLISK